MNMKRFIFTMLFVVSGCVSIKAMEEIPMDTTIQSIEEIDPQSELFALECTVHFNNSEYTVVKNEHEVRQTRDWDAPRTYRTVILTRPIMLLSGSPLLEDTIVVQQWACGKFKEKTPFKDRGHLKGYYRNQSTQLTHAARVFGLSVGTWLGSIALYKVTHS